ncbi:MAG: hypothetical protein WBG43_09905 [Marinifilaceae bacterium]
MNDPKANAVQLFGLSEQYASSAYNALKISQVLYDTDTELTFTGHSLGVGQAALNALLTDRKVFTFNAAGVSAQTTFNLGDFKTPLFSGHSINNFK